MAIFSASHAHEECTAKVKKVQGERLQASPFLMQYDACPTSSGVRSAPEDKSVFATLWV